MSRLLAVMAFVAAAVLPSAGCVLVVPELQHDPHCGFTGTSACGTCLKTSCQTAIDACCSDSACNGGDGHSEALDAIDACAGGNQDACASGLGGAVSGTAGAMRTCVTTTCKDACVGNVTVPVVPSKWTCDTTRTNDNACATCVYGMCGTSLDACCGDSSCKDSSTLQDDVGRCTSGDAPGCAYLTTEGTSGYEGAVRGCITTKCATKCMGDGRLHQSCSLEGGGTYCSCSDAEKSSGVACTAAAMGGTCVRGAKGCTCGHYTCINSTSSLGGCSCSFRGSDDTATTCDVDRTGSMAGICCIKREDTGFTCGCETYKTKCYSDEYDTPTCNVMDVMNNLTNVVVTSCSN